MPMLTDQRPITWQDVLDDPSLKNLPYKIELNRRGQIEMSPATNLHNIYQIAITDLLLEFAAHGKRFQECSIETSNGVRVADAVWLSKEFLALHGRVTPYTRAPEICIEIISPSNTNEEMLEKIGLYLERGALEVWTCNLQGEIKFFDANGTLEQSKLVQGFPTTVTLE
jgi:Uma2 family endonuclease